MRRSILELLEQKWNDYTPLEELFLERTGVRLVSETPQSLANAHLTAFVSVVVPVYKGVRLPLLIERLNAQSYLNFQLILVDDCPAESSLELVQDLDVSYEVKYIRHATNRGRPYTRNTGISNADGDIVILLDQDMMVGEDFVASFALRVQEIPDGLFLGFKENTEVPSYRSTPFAPSLARDWRYHQEPGPFINLTRRPAPATATRAYALLHETEYLKQLGGGSSVDFWDLPSLVVSHSLAFSRYFAVRSGGFLEGRFHGWGVEDTAFGASMIANGCFVIPVPEVVSYHLNHDRYSGSREIEMQEFRSNLARYFEYLEEPLSAPLTRHHVTPLPPHHGIIIFEHS